MTHYPLAASAGIDLHKETYVVCVRLVSPEHGVRVKRRVFGTFADDLRALVVWLQQHNVTHVAMEGTGTLWVPVYATLEPHFDLTLCNAHHVRNVPGRKTDQSDAAWLAQLLSQGLLAKSFVPPEDIRRARELTRARVMVIENRTRAINHVHRHLDALGVRLGNVVTDLQGATAQAILHALADGVTDVKQLTDLARGKLRSKRDELRRAVAVPLLPEQRYLLSMWLREIAHLDAEIEALDTLIAAALAKHTAELTLLRTIKGMDVVAASALLAEIGVDMAAFADAHHLSSWAGLCPGQRESAGKNKSGKLRRGNPFVKRILVQAAWSLSRSKSNPWASSHVARRTRRGTKRALVALAHQLLRAIYAMLRQGVPFQPAPPTPPTEPQRRRRCDRLITRLEQLGYSVEVREAA
jgi:transposase